MSNAETFILWANFTSAIWKLCCFLTSFKQIPYEASGYRRSGREEWKTYYSTLIRQNHKKQQNLKVILQHGCHWTWTASRFGPAATHPQPRAARINLVLILLQENCPRALSTQKRQSKQTFRQNNVKVMIDVYTGLKKTFCDFKTVNEWSISDIK